MDRTTGIMMGIAGSGVILTLGYGIWSQVSAPKNQILYQHTKDDVGSSNGVGLQSSSQKEITLPLNTTRDNDVGDQQKHSLLSGSWKEKYPTPHISQDRVLYNALDSLSVYGHRDKELFIDIVHYVEQFCILYQTVMATTDATDSFTKSTHKNKNPILLAHSTILQTKMFRAIGDLEKATITTKSSSRDSTQFQERSQLLIDIVNNYHVNIIRELQS